MKFQHLFLILGILLATQSHAQNWPPFKVDAYDTSSKGYYFFAPLRAVAHPTVRPSHLVLDDKGKVIYFRTFKWVETTSDFKIQKNGLMTFSYRGKFYALDSNFNLIDSFSCKNGITTDTHDFIMMENGHYLLMGTEGIGMNLSKFPYFNRNGSVGDTLSTVKCGVIQELDENRNVVFEWHAKDHFDFSDVDSNYLNNPKLVDWTHFNAFEIDTDGNILLSVRYFNEITKIYKNDSSIMWRLGGKRNQFVFENDSLKFLAQHDIRRLPNGNLTIYDNGFKTEPIHSAEGKEYSIDEKSKIVKLIWNYVENKESYSQAVGNVQRLPNGNTLINYGLMTQGNLVFNVIKPDNSKAFQISFDDSVGSYRSFNYFLLPWSLNRPHITCFDSAGKQYLDAGIAKRYKWSTGDTTRYIEVQKPDTYSVFIPKGNFGGFIRSEEIVVTNTSDPCNKAAIKFTYNQKIANVYPNPSSGTFFLDINKGQIDTSSISCFDLTGRLIPFSVTKSLDGISIDLPNVRPGIYFLEIENQFVKLEKL